ncbi:MAG TPA: hypothetical protein PLM34_08950, partial [Lentimicrobium sp.]|nr:hypothetical protein [Lentimicrobium sp.]
TITGVDGVAIVTEPTISGLLDLKRTVEIVTNYKLKKWVIINKSDLSENRTQEICEYCDASGIPVIAKIPFDPQVVEAMVNCKTITEYIPGSALAKTVAAAWKEIKMNVQSTI